MVAVTPADGIVWAIIVAMGVGTYALRLSFIGLSGHVEGLPPWLEQALRYVPAAVIAAIVFPALVVVDGSVTIAGNYRLLAGAFAAAVAWRTEDILATIVAGVGALLVIQAVL